MFECKAAINYYVFNRAAEGVVISDDKRYLFFKETMDKGGTRSSFSGIGADEITLIVNNLNTIYDHYRKCGFTEVYFSMIPNPVTILQPKGYNNLIPAIQNDPRLRMKLIDIYTAFKNSKEDLYLHADTHWNIKGKQMWVDSINKIIAQHNL
jgi:hypothetical protein